VDPGKFTENLERKISTRRIRNARKIATT